MSDSYRVERYRDEEHGEILRERQEARKHKRKEQRSFLKIERPIHEDHQRGFAFDN